MPADTAATFASLFYIGVTVGRAISGFVTMKLTDHQMIRLGQAIIGLGVIIMLIPGPYELSLAGFILTGLGCAPIYPSVIHSTPATFGPQLSQSIIGVEMASAYVGTCVMPPIFGLIANHITPALLPVYLLVILALMVLMHTQMIRKAPNNAK